MRTDTTTLIGTLRTIAKHATLDEIGYQNAAIDAAADRLEELARQISDKCRVAIRIMDERDDLRQRLADMEARATNAEESLATFYPKLPTYIDTGKAFVPGYDRCYAKVGGRVVRATPEYRITPYFVGWAFAHLDNPAVESATRCYSSPAACEADSKRADPAT